MGRHASAERRRSVAAWPIIVGVVVLLLVAATVGYFRVIDDGNQQSAACSGTTVLPVVVAPGAAPAVEQAAQAFNATKPEARSTCVSVAVTTASGPATVTALAGGWRGQRTPAPGLWIADSAADVAALDAASPTLTAGHATGGLASSPVVLAVRQVPTGTPVSWTALASGSGGLVLGIGDPAANRGSAAALQSLIRGGSGTPTAAAAIDAAAVTTAEPALARLADGSLTVPPTTDLALTGLAGGKSRYTAVPVLECQLATFNSVNRTTLTAVYPTGPTAGAQVMPIPLTANWVGNAMSDAAAAFDGFLGNPAGTKILTAAHLRTAAAPVAAPGVDLRTPVTALPDAGAPAGAALATAWATAVGRVSTTSSSSAGGTTVEPSGVSTAADAGATVSGLPSTTPTMPPPSTATAATATTTTVAPTSRTVTAAPAITFLVDASGSMSTVNNGAQRLTWVKSAVSTVVQQRPGSLFGLWSFATSTSKDIPLGPPDQLIGGTPRSSAIIGALNQLTPRGYSYTYGAIRTAFTDAATDVVPGGVHRLILFTDGSDSTPGLTRDAVKATVAALAAQHPGLTLDIIGLSSSVNEQALTEIAAAGRGTFRPLTTLADLAPTLLALST